MHCRRGEIGLRAVIEGGKFAVLYRLVRAASWPGSVVPGAGVAVAARRLNVWARSLPLECEVAEVNR